MHADEHYAQIEDAPNPCHREPRRLRRRMAETAGRDLNAINAARSMCGLLALIPDVPDASQNFARKPAEKPTPSANAWPTDFPRPTNAKFKYPAVGALVAWLGLENRKYDAHEIADMTSVWATEATKRGLLAPDPTKPTERTTIPRKPVPRPGRVANLGNRRAA
ncbi:hypothetical protein [Actinoallomurus iriomotensis]|uniref:Uncharacterized protein n=1 Tax=Actinoallomurus iriomotensis TaxID=478107 RepID=A0A9W6VX93_9ACTN|nr:hypothetical protein [Actinoallomurus iriomotensis]GLY81576.1 hypothetical protein Airi01_098430 [Actinoallomurus iriomotensis]